jgi:hypothetical protein
VDEVTVADLKDMTQPYVAPHLRVGEEVLRVAVDRD